MMPCERCGSGAEAIFRVHSDILDMLVCVGCAHEAEAIGIPVDPLLNERNDSPRLRVSDGANKARFLARTMPC
jgi:hypothetical protein